MLEKIKQSLLPFWSSNKRNPIILVGAALLLSTAVVFSLWNGNQGYVPLFGSQQNVPVAKVVEVLGGEGMPYRVNPDSGQILVKENLLGKARMMLASKGISTILPTGYELMDKEQMLGSSQFLQSVRYKRSLEGELSQSIMALDPVEFARVHLALVESSSFVVSAKPESSASVMVKLKYNHQLNQEQVSAVVQLVAGSLPGMQADNVRVVDQHGNLLSGSYLSEAKGAANVKNRTDIAEQIKAETTANLSQLLISVVGADNFRISVAPKINLSKVEETQERYLGDPRVSDENLNKENTTNELALGIPGSLSNRPTNSARQNNPEALSTRNQQQRKYAYDRDIRHILYPGYNLEKLAVAIVVNQSATHLQKWTPQQLDDLKKLMIEGAGLDMQRGDSLTMNLLAFSPPAVVNSPIVQWWQDSAIQYWAKLGFIGLLALLLLLFVVRPLMRKFKDNSDQPQQPLTTTDSEGNTLAMNDQHQAESEILAKDHGFPPQSSGLEEKVACLQSLTQSETERVAEVLKQWINSNGMNNHERPDAK